MSDSTGIVDDKKGIQLANLALAEGLISPDQWSEALAVQSREFSEGRAARSLIEILQTLEFLRPEQIDLLTEKMRGRRASPEGGGIELESAEAGKFGKFLVVRKIGIGPQGKIYEAYDPERKRRVALKIVRRSSGSDEEELARERTAFLAEGRKMSAVPTHPNLVRAYEAGVVHGKRYVATDLVVGLPWHGWMQKDKNLLQILLALRDAARALQHAHEHGIIHGRLKPQNLMVDENDQVRITDAGLGRAVRHDPRALVTASRFPTEMASYLSPEQGQGNAAVDARADVYALGALLYEVLAGEPPYKADTAVQTLLRASNEKLPRPSTLAREHGLGGADPGLERIALRAMARYPDDRYPTAGAFADELTRWLGGQQDGFLSRHGAKIALGAVLAAAACGLAAYFLLR